MGENQRKEPRPTGWARAALALFRPVDIASLVAFRVLFGLLMAHEGVDLVVHGYSSLWVERSFFFTYSGFHWVRPLPDPWAHVHLYTLSLLGLMIALGALYRLSAALFFVGFTWMFLIDGTEHLNHFYLICLISFLMIFLPAHRSFSVDAWLRPGLRAERIPAWPVFALRAQLGIVYVYGGLAKFDPDWLRGMPLEVWLPQRLTAPLIAGVADERRLALGIAWSGLFLDLLLVPALLYRPTRALAFIAAVAFHLSNSVIWHIGVFPWLAIAATLLFFDPDWPRRVFRWPETGDSPARSSGFAWDLPRSATAAGLAVFFAVQLLVPLRHHLYPGRASWNEEGHHFAWRMMLREKSGTVLFKLEDPLTGRDWLVDPREALDARQAARLPHYPRWLHLYANHLADQREAETGRRPRVQAMTLVSLNGRRPVPIVDPTVDLAAEPEPVFRGAPWVIDLDDDRFEKDPIWQDIARDLAASYRAGLP